jgi:hypothetical protein
MADKWAIKTDGYRENLFSPIAAGEKKQGWDEVILAIKMRCASLKFKLV